MQIIFNNIKVPKEELNAVVEKNMEQIQRQCHRKKVRTILAGCSAAVILAAAGIGFCAMNPVLAEQIPLIGHLFERVEDKQRYPGELSKDAEPVHEGNVSESGGIKMTLSEIYCNTEAINISVLVESKEPFPEIRHDADQTAGDKTISYQYLDLEEHFDFMPESLQESVQVNEEYLDDHTFAGGFRIEFNLGELSQVEIPDNFHLDLSVNAIHILSNSLEKEASQLSGDTPWEFSVDVSKDSEQTVTKEINQYAPNGSGVGTVSKTPYEIILNGTFSEEHKVTDEPLQMVILDADGKYMPDKGGIMLPIKDHNVSKITLYYYPVASEEEFIAIQERYRDDDFEQFIKSKATFQIQVDFQE